MIHESAPSNTEIEDANIIVEYLKRIDEFITASEISRHTGLTTRRIRLVTQAYPHLLVTGQRGYKLGIYATDREVAECVHHLMSRAQQLMGRATALTEYALR